MYSDKLRSLDSGEVVPLGCVSRCHREQNTDLAVNVKHYRYHLAKGSKIVGFVTAENGFGGNSREMYTCTATWLPESKSWDITADLNG